MDAAGTDSKTLPERIQQPSTALTLGLLLLLLVLLTLLRNWLKGPKGRAVLILGPCAAGKTTLFLQLRDGSSHRGTVASMQENVDSLAVALLNENVDSLGVPLPNMPSILLIDQSFVVSSHPGSAASTQENVDSLAVTLPNGGSKSVQLVDVPGHPRVRGKFRSYLDKARGIMFVVDAVDFTPHKTSTAEQLYEVLEQNAVRKKKLPLLLVCNKADQGAKAHTINFIQKQLEKELDQLRVTRRTLGDATSTDLLPKADTPFTFEALSKSKGAQVRCCSASALSPDVEGITSFLQQIAAR